MMDTHEDKHYDEFKYVNRAVIVTPIKGINTKSDLKVSVDHRRLGEGHKVTHLKFLIEPGPNTSNELLKKLKNIKKIAEQTRQALDDVEINEPLYDRLSGYGFKEKKILAILKTYKNKIEYVNEILDSVDNKIQTGTVRNVGGYIMKALEEDYRPV